MICSLPKRVHPKEFAWLILYQAVFRDLRTSGFNLGNYIVEIADVVCGIEAVGGNLEWYSLLSYDCAREDVDGRGCIHAEFTAKLVELILKAFLHADAESCL